MPLIAGHNCSPGLQSAKFVLLLRSTDGCQIFHRKDREFIEGQWYQPSGKSHIPGNDETESLIAIEPSNGRIKWRFIMVENPSGGTL